MKNNDKLFLVKARLKSFVYAWQGIQYFIKNEHNARLHLLATVIVIIAGAFFKINMQQWLAILFCIALVWVCEMLNTALEKLCNHIQPDYNAHIKIVKDMAAGAVLVAAIIAAITGLLIFIPLIISIV
jgi:diacylglycerol kinase (ATP)